MPEFYTIFAQKMPEFYIIIARKMFFPEFWGARAPISYAYVLVCFELQNTNLTMMNLI